MLLKPLVVHLSEPSLRHLLVVHLLRLVAREAVDGRVDVASQRLADALVSSPLVARLGEEQSWVKMWAALHGPARRHP